MGETLIAWGYTARSQLVSLQTSGVSHIPKHHVQRGKISGVLCGCATWVAVLTAETVLNFRDTAGLLPSALQPLPGYPESTSWAPLGSWGRGFHQCWAHGLRPGFPNDTLDAACEVIKVGVFTASNYALCSLGMTF